MHECPQATRAALTHTVPHAIRACRKSSTFVGLILTDVKLPFPNHGHVVLGDPSPILVYPISSTEARVLVDIPPSAKMPSSAGGELREYLMRIVHPQLPVELQGRFAEAVQTAKLRSMQNKQLAANPLHPPGALLLGDSFNMRHPLTGGGMTVALSDTKLLCDMLQPLPDFTDCIKTAQCTSDFYLKRKPLSSTINTLANALYEVFRQKDTAAHEEMRQAAFDYLALGAH
jgi:squalene monooxygenase